MMSVSMKAALDEKSLKKFRQKFGETSNQALIRYGVEVGRSAAIATKPPGRSKKQIVANIVTGTRVNIADLPAKTFNKISKSPKPFFRFKAGPARLTDRQILKSPKDILDYVAENRGDDGRVKRLPPSEKAVCRTPDMNKALTERKKRAGVTKGAWLGAAMDLAKKAKGPTPPRIGKNFMAFAQKHSGKGHARFIKRILRKSEVHLISEAPASLNKKIFGKEDAKLATREGWKKTLGWYKRAVKAKFS